MQLGVSWASVSPLCCSPTALRPVGHCRRSKLKKRGFSDGGGQNQSVIQAMVGDSKRECCADQGEAGSEAIEASPLP